MSDSKKKVPKRRFEEFSNANDWEQRKLGENAVIKGRLGWKSLKQEEYIPDGPSMIAGKHIKNGEIDWEKVDHIPLWRYKESPEIMLGNGDVIFSKDGSLGNPALITNLRELATINSTMMLVRTDNTIDSGFFYQIMTSDIFKKLVYIKVSGSSIPHLFQSDMKNFQFHSPIVEEQQKLGTFFKQLDDTIALHQRKLEKIKALKTAYLSEMFPAEGELKPKRRFAGFTDDWELRKLEELATFSKGNSYTKNDLIDNGKPIILYGRLYTRYQTVIEAVDTFAKEKFNSVISEGNEVLVPASGETSEEISRASVIGKSGVVLGGDLNIIKPNESIDSIFLALTISNGGQKKELSKRAQGKSVVHLHNSDLKQVNLLYPKLEEQQKIGIFFKQLDNTIALHQRKLQKLQNIKKAYLNEMFI